MATTVHLAESDGLLEAAARAARLSDGDDLVLVVPEGAPVLANPLFLETLRDLRGGRRLTLVTGDPRGRAIASGVRIPAFASLTAFEQQTVDATEELEKRRLEAIAQIGHERRRRRAVRRRTVIAVAVAVIVLLAFVPSAEVTVAGEEANIGPVELDVNATASGLISATSFVTRLTPSVDAKATGSRTDRAKATGVERFSNVSTDRIDVPVGTLIWTTANVMFRTTQAKSIAPSTFFPFLVNEAQIPIEAVEAGAAGNVVRGEIRNVADRRVRVTNDQPTAGGDEKQIALATVGDYSAASANLDQAIDGAIRAQLASWRQSLPEGRRLEDHYTTKTILRTASADVVGKEADSFRLSATIELTAYGVPSGEPRTTAALELTRLVPAEHELVPDTLRIDIPSVRFTTDGLTWHVLASGKHRPRLDEGALQLALVGQDRAAAAKLLEPRGMKLVELRAFPNWWPRLPLLPVRIDVRSAAGS